MLKQQNLPTNSNSMYRINFLSVCLKLRYVLGDNHIIPKLSQIPLLIWSTANLFFFSIFSEYDSLLRLGITDPKGFIKKRYKSEPIVYLSTCCAGRGLQEHIEASVEEALSDGSWVDIMVRIVVFQRSK